MGDRDTHNSQKRRFWLPPNRAQHYELLNDDHKNECRAYCESAASKLDHIEDEESFFSSLFLNYIHTRIDTPDVIPFFFSDRAYSIFMDLPPHHQQAALLHCYQSVQPPFTKPMRVYTKIFMEYLENREYYEHSGWHQNATRDSSYGPSSGFSLDPTSANGSDHHQTTTTHDNLDDGLNISAIDSEESTATVHTTTHYTLDNGPNNSLTGPEETTAVSVQDSHFSMVSPALPLNDQGELDSPRHLEDSSEPSLVERQYKDLQARLEMVTRECDELRRENEQLREQNKDWEVQQNSVQALQERLQSLQKQHTTVLDVHQGMTKKCHAASQEIHQLQKAKQQLKETLELVQDQSQVQDVEIEKLLAKIARLREKRRVDKATKRQVETSPARDATQTTSPKRPVTRETKSARRAVTSPKCCGTQETKSQVKSSPKRRVAHEAKSHATTSPKPLAVTSLKGRVTQEAKLKSSVETIPKRRAVTIPKGRKTKQAAPKSPAVKPTPKRHVKTSPKRATSSNKRQKMQRPASPDSVFSDDDDEKSAFESSFWNDHCSIS